MLAQQAMSGLRGQQGQLVAQGLTALLGLPAILVPLGLPGQQALKAIRGYRGQQVPMAPPGLQAPQVRLEGQRGLLGRQGLLQLLLARLGLLDLPGQLARLVLRPQGHCLSAANHCACAVDSVDAKSRQPCQ